MNKNYQTTTAASATVDDLVMSEAVSVAMSELTGAVKEGLLAPGSGGRPAGDAGVDG